MANPNPRHSMGSDTSSTRRNAPNFSRPQPQQSAMKSGRKNNDGRHVHIIEAFHEPNRDFPDEPRFSEESERTDQTSSENSAGSDFAWDGQTGELDVARTQRSQRPAQQRYAYAATARPGTPRTNSSVSAAEAQNFELGLPREASASSSAFLQPSQQIVKRVSVDQRSEHLSPGPASAAEADTASHHTASESGGDTGSIDMEGRWHSSEYDISSLSERELRRMEKKGIDPALYLEMKEAKKGKKKWMPQLLGNGYVN